MATSLDDLISANQAELRKAKKDYDELFDKFKLASQLFEERDGVYRAKIGELEETVSQLKRKNDNLKFIINNQNATKEAFAEDVKQLQEVSQLLETREKSLTEACEILQRENRLQASEINELKSRLSQREDQYLRLEVLMQETMVPKTDLMAQQQRLQVMEDALHTDHVPKDVYERLAQECEALKAHMTSAMVEKATFEQLQHTHLELERRVPVDFVPIAEYAKLKRLLQEAVDERRLVAESAQVVQDQRDQQMTNYREIEAKAISLKGRVEHQEAEIRELRHEKESLSAELLSLRSTHLDTEDDRQQLRETIRELETAKNHLTSQCGHLKLQCQHEAHAKQEALDARKAIEKQIDQLRYDYNMRIIDSNQKMNGVFETSERQYQQRLHEVTEHNQRLQLQCHGTLQEIDLLHQENEHLRHHCRDVEALIADAKTQLTLQLASQETTLRDNELLRQQAQIWQAEKEQLFERLQRLQHDNQELHNYLEEFRLLVFSELSPTFRKFLVKPDDGGDDVGGGGGGGGGGAGGYDGYYDDGYGGGGGYGDGGRGGGRLPPPAATPMGDVQRLLFSPNQHASSARRSDHTPPLQSQPQSQPQSQSRTPSRRTPSAFQEKMHQFMQHTSSPSPGRANGHGRMAHAAAAAAAGGGPGPGQALESHPSFVSELSMPALTSPPSQSQRPPVTAGIPSYHTQQNPQHQQQHQQQHRHQQSSMRAAARHPPDDVSTLGGDEDDDDDDGDEEDVVVIVPRDPTRYTPPSASPAAAPPKPSALSPAIAGRQHSHGPASNGRSLAGRGASASGSATGSSALLRVSQTPVATSAAKSSAQTPPAPPVTSPTSYPAAPVSAPSPRSLLAQPRPHPTPLAKAATTSDAVAPSGTLHAKTVMQNSARLLRKLIKAPSADNVVPRTASGRNLLHTSAATTAAAAQSLHIDTDLNDLLHDVIDGVVADDEPADAPTRPTTATATATTATPSAAVAIAAPSHGGINVTKPALNSPRSHAMAKSLSVTPSSTPGAVASFRPSAASAAAAAAAHVTATATKPTSTAAAAATPSVFFPPEAPSPATATATALDATLDDAVDDSMRMHDHALVQSYRRGLH